MQSNTPKFLRYRQKGPYGRTVKATQWNGTPEDLSRIHDLLDPDSYAVPAKFEDSIAVHNRRLTVYLWPNEWLLIEENRQGTMEWATSMPDELFQKEYTLIE